MLIDTGFKLNRASRLEVIAAFNVLLNRGEIPQGIHYAFEIYKGKYHVAMWQGDRNNPTSPVYFTDPRELIAAAYSKPVISGLES